MKHLALLFTAMLLIGCGSDWTPPPARNISMAIDHTDPHLVGTLAEDVPQIMEALGLEDDLYGGVVVRFRTIGPVPNDRVQELRLEAADPDEANTVQRRSRVKRFKADVEETLRTHIILQPEAGATMFYMGVASELNYLASRDGPRLLLVYSDGLEHSIGMDMYADSIIDSLRVQPERYRAYCENQAKLADLTGVEVVLANVAKNNQNGLRVLKAFELASGLFTAHGAHVRSTGNFIKSELVTRR